MGGTTVWVSEYTRVSAVYAYTNNTSRENLKVALEAPPPWLFQTGAEYSPTACVEKFNWYGLSPSGSGRKKRK